MKSHELRPFIEEEEEEETVNFPLVVSNKSLDLLLPLNGNLKIIENNEVEEGITQDVVPCTIVDVLVANSASNGVTIPSSSSSSSPTLSFSQSMMNETSHDHITVIVPTSEKLE